MAIMYECGAYVTFGYIFSATFVTWWIGYLLCRVLFCFSSLRLSPSSSLLHRVTDKIYSVPFFAVHMCYLKGINISTIYVFWLNSSVWKRREIKYRMYIKINIINYRSCGVFCQISIPFPVFLYANCFLFTFLFYIYFHNKVLPLHSCLPCTAERVLKHFLFCLIVYNSFHSSNRMELKTTLTSH